MGSACERLTNFLRASEKAVVRMTFAEVERVRSEPLPPSARKHAAWWSNSQHSAKCWTQAGYRTAQVNLRDETLHFIKDQAVESEVEPRRAPRSRWPAAKLLADLDREFEQSIGACAERAIFTGPSVYFYERTVNMVRSAKALRDLAGDDLFCEYAYATLTAWGMHRMGESVATKLTDYPTFSAAVRSFLEEVEDLKGASICDLSDEEAAALTKRLAKLVEKPGITTSGAPLVANTKTMHFILPDLVPPVDRTYTCRLFYGRMQPPGDAAEVFGAVFPLLAGLAKRHEATVKKATGTYLCLGHAKALDNAIVGFVLNHPEHFPGKRQQPPAEEEQ